MQNKLKVVASLFTIDFFLTPKDSKSNMHFFVNNHGKIYILDSDLVWRMQLLIIKGKKFVLCV